MVRTVDVRIRSGRSGCSGKKGGGGARSSSATVSKSSFGQSTSSIGGNPVCPRETPGWQKPITNFFRKVDEADSSTDIREEFVEQGSSNTGASDIKCTVQVSEDSNESRKQPVCLEGEDTLSLEITTEKNKDSVKSQRILGSPEISTEQYISESSSETGNGCENSNSKRKRMLNAEDSPESPAFESLDETDDITKRIRLEENVSANNSENEEKCKTPSTERKQ